MRILFFGTAAFATPSLEQLVVQGQQVLLCVTRPDRPQGRGMAVLPSPIKSAAHRLGLSVEEPDDLDELLPRFQGLEPDLGVVISYGRLIPSELLRLPDHGMLGVHPSLLPKYRGASPIAWAILNGEQTTGVTVFRLNERLDAGDILLHRTVAIEPQETAESLSGRLAIRGAELLLEAIDRLEHGTNSFHPQDEQLATYAPKLTKGQGQINWNAQAFSIDRLVRALTPWPGASTTWRGQSLKLWVTSCTSQNHPSAVPGTAGAGSQHERPGEVLSASPDGLAVATGAGTLVIRELQMAGRRRMTVQEFLAGHDIKVGEILGTERRSQ